MNKHISQEEIREGVEISFTAFLSQLSLPQPHRAKSQGILYMVRLEGGKKIKAKEQKRTVDRAVNVKSQMIIILFSLHFVSMCEFNFSQIIKGNNLICSRGA